MKSNSLTDRTSLWFTLLAIAVFLVMGMVILISVDHHFRDQDHNELNGKLELIQSALLGADLTANGALLKQQLAVALIGHHHLSVLIKSPDGQIYFTTGKAIIPEAILGSAQPLSRKSIYKLQAWNTNSESYRALSVRLPSARLNAGWIVVIATDTHYHRDFLATFRNELILIGSGGLALMAGMGWLVTRRGFRPVLDMANVAEGISAQQFDERLLTEQVPIELQPLARAFNSMLDRLADSLQRLSAFSSDLAHELRTPINNLMTQTQVSLSRPRTSDQYREVLYSNLEEYERLGRMIADMLLLAKADNGLMMPHLKPVNLRCEVDALFEFYDALAAEAQLSLTVEGDGCIQGDALMLRRALSNLLSNAIRHADAGTKISVQLRTTPERVNLRLCNIGAEIPAEHLPRLFDRFYRVDDSRQRQDEGAGLGLAITHRIIKAHNGDISVTSVGRQTCFSVTLPIKQE